MKAVNYRCLPIRRRRGMHLVIATSFLLGMCQVHAQDAQLPESAIGLSRIVLKRVQNGTPISAAKKELEKLGFTCIPGKQNSHFGPVGYATFIYCEHREKSKIKHGVINRWQVSVIYRKGKVTGSQAAFNPIYP